MPFVLLFLAAVDPSAPLSGFLKAYCADCHGERIQMAKRRLDRLPLDPAVSQMAVERLTARTMPPAGAKQPLEEERRAVIALLARPQTTLRRLNRREYLNTIADLFGLNMSTFDPTSRFPRDQQSEHMDNNDEALVTSGYLLEQYLDAADQVVNKALRKVVPVPEQTWVFNKQFLQQPELDRERRAVGILDYMVLYEHPRTPHYEGAFGPLREFEQGVPVDGWYEVKALAEARNRRNPYDPALLGMDPEAPFRLGVVPGSPKAGLLHHSQTLEPVLGEVVLKDDVREWQTFRVWLDAGYQPRFIFPNGINDVRMAFSRFPHIYADQMPEEIPGGIVPGRRAMMAYGKLPHIRIYEVRIRGPIEQPDTRRAVFADAPFTPERAREILTGFAERAYRRPARPEEIDRLMAIRAKRQQEGQPPEEALKDALKAALCSPAFLYLSEEGVYGLASRLSYFLWSAMPDEELMRDARSGALLKDNVLLAQTRRMLASPRSEAFVNGFLDSWLNLRSLGDMPPDRDAFSFYYWGDLQAAMKTETRMMMRRLLDENISVMDFIDARYTFVNKPLASLYGIGSVSNEDGQKFRRVELTDPRRGGLLGQGSVLTASANGVETSPVTRGVWMLENIFGTPPAPPPGDVPSLDPDVRGSKSVRDLLTKHRESAACMSCHRTIDPPGFALENFDPVGGWREKYPNGAAIDASGEIQGLGKFDDVVGLKKLLAGRRTEFTRMLTGRLLTYACGRQVASAELAQVAMRGDGMRDLVEAVVLSDAFRRK